MGLHFTKNNWYFATMSFTYTGRVWYIKGR